MIGKLLSPQRWRAKLAHELSRAQLRLHERSAWRSLAQRGGPHALAAMREAIAAAERYRAWDAWSLSRESLLWAAELLASGAATRLIEFGAGYSTVALASFCRSLGLPAQIDSFEHQAIFADRLRAQLSGAGPVKLHQVELASLDDAAFSQMFTTTDPAALFAAKAQPIAAEAAFDTRLPNAFYRIDPQYWPGGSVDLIILDGPNGNGRSLAFPLLRAALRRPAYLLIDDYLDYPFLADLARVTPYQLLRRAEVGGKEAVLVRVG